MKRIILAVLLTLIIVSCENREPLPAEAQFLDTNFLGTCFTSGIYNKDYEEVIISDTQSYQNYGNSIRMHFSNLDCSTAALPYIDFNKYFLVGKFTGGGGCSVKYDRLVIDDKENKKYIYRIKATYSGGCYMYIVNMNWALIPKTNGDYTVEFQVE